MVQGSIAVRIGMLPVLRKSFHKLSQTRVARVILGGVVVFVLELNINVLVIFDKFKRRVGFPPLSHQHERGHAVPVGAVHVCARPDQH